MHAMVPFAYADFVVTGNADPAILRSRRGSRATPTSAARRGNDRRRRPRPFVLRTVAQRCSRSRSLSHARRIETETSRRSGTGACTVGCHRNLFTAPSITCSPRTSLTFGPSSLLLLENHPRPRSDVSRNGTDPGHAGHGPDFTKVPRYCPEIRVSQVMFRPGSAHNSRIVRTLRASPPP